MYKPMSAVENEGSSLVFGGNRHVWWRLSAQMFDDNWSHPFYADQRNFYNSRSGAGTGSGLRKCCLLGMAQRIFERFIAKRPSSKANDQATNGRVARVASIINIETSWPYSKKFGGGSPPEKSQSVKALMSSHS